MIRHHAAAAAARFLPSLVLFVILCTVPAVPASAQWGFGGWGGGWGYPGWGWGYGGIMGMPNGYPGGGMAYGYANSPGPFGPPYLAGYGFYGLPVAGLPIGFPGYGLVAPNPMFGLGLTPLGAQSGLAEAYLLGRGTGTTAPQGVLIQRKQTTMPTNAAAPAAGTARPGL